MVMLHTVYVVAFEIFCFKSVRRPPTASVSPTNGLPVIDSQVIKRI